MWKLIIMWLCSALLSVAVVVRSSCGVEWFKLSHLVSKDKSPTNLWHVRRKGVKSTWHHIPQMFLTFSTFAQLGFNKLPLRQILIKSHLLFSEHYWKLAALLRHVVYKGAIILSVGFPITQCLHYLTYFCKKKSPKLTRFGENQKQYV